MNYYSKEREWERLLYVYVFVEILKVGYLKKVGESFLLWMLKKCFKLCFFCVVWLFIVWLIILFCVVVIFVEVVVIFIYKICSRFLFEFERIGFIFLKVIKSFEFKDKLECKYRYWVVDFNLKLRIYYYKLFWFLIFD